MPDKLAELLKQYVKDLKKIYGSHLLRVVLYGSYARGDYTPESDVDIMIFLDLTDKEMIAYDDKLDTLSANYLFDHDIYMHPYPKNLSFFNGWKDAIPFYANVQREGVTLYDAA